MISWDLIHVFLQEVREGQSSYQGIQEVLGPLLEIVASKSNIKQQYS
jgi:hypothetical protein